MTSVHWRLFSPSPASVSEWWGGVGGGGPAFADDRSACVVPPPRFALLMRCEPTLPTASRGEGKGRALGNAPG